MKPPHILIASVGNIQKEAHARIKYGMFVDAFSQHAEIQLCDVTLRGLSRMWNALKTMHPNPMLWRERFWQNIPAFEARSKILSQAALQNRPDLLLQIGVTYDGSRFQKEIPVCIYTDYTAALSAKRVGTTRSPFSERDRQRWLDMEAEAYQRARHIFVRSHFVEKSLIQEYGIAAEKITVCGGGVNIHPLPQVQPRPITESPRALFIGKEFLRKGGDLLLQAFAIARKEYPYARLRVVTGNPIPDHLPTNGVEVFPATWDREEIYEHYRAADIFVLPSRLETWGDVLLEAMSFGIPCIGVESDAMGEIIASGESGLLTPSGNVAALAEALSILFRNAGQRIRMGETGRQRVEKLFTWKKVVAQICATLEERKIL